MTTEQIITLYTISLAAGLSLGFLVAVLRAVLTPWYNVHSGRGHVRIIN